MRENLQKIRKPQKNQSMISMISTTFGIALAGFLLGVFQKWLDSVPSNELPYIIEYLDFGNYFGRLSIWILLATIISVNAKTPFRASINTFMFFMSMLAGYYLYCNYVLGFFPRSYMMIWVVMSIVSFFLAYVCWYAKGEGKVAIIISSIILAVLFSLAVLIKYGVRITYPLEVITWLVGVIVLYRNPKEFKIELGLSFVIAFIFQFAFPYYI